jgi:hypothetical protein
MSDRSFLVASDGYRFFGFAFIIYFNHPMLILAHFESFILKLTQKMFTIDLLLFVTSEVIISQSIPWVLIPLGRLSGILN